MSIRNKMSTQNILQRLMTLCWLTKIDKNLEGQVVMEWAQSAPLIGIGLTNLGGSNCPHLPPPFLRPLTHWLQILLSYYKPVYIRCLMVSTNQADPGCLYFRISWILMERCWFYFFHPLHFLQGLRSLKHWLLQKFDQKFRFLIKK